MVRRGLTVYTAGNVSIRSEDDAGFYIKPSSVRYADIRPEDLVLVDWEGHPISGSRPPSIEHNMHRLVYLARPDATAIVHSHSLYATTLSASKLHCGIPATLGEIAHYLGGPILLAEYGAPGSMDLAQNVVRCLGKETHGVLLKNHGALAVGRDLAQALEFAELIEMGAQSYILVQLLGGYDEHPESYCLDSNLQDAR
jgi:L-fuculose-phosphate aldolase